jgi:hypothetical protein
MQFFPRMPHFFPRMPLPRIFRACHFRACHFFHFAANLDARKSINLLERLHDRLIFWISAHATSMRGTNNKSHARK